MTRKSRSNSTGWETLIKGVAVFGFLCVAAVTIDALSTGEAAIVSDPGCLSFSECGSTNPLPSDPWAGMVNDLWMDGMDPAILDEFGRNRRQNTRCLQQCDSPKDRDDQICQSLPSGGDGDSEARRLCWQRAMNEYARCRAGC